MYSKSKSYSTPISHCIKDSKKHYYWKPYPDTEVGIQKKWDEEAKWKIPNLEVFLFLMFLMFYFFKNIKNNSLKRSLCF